MVMERSESLRQKAQWVLALGLLAGFVLVIFGLVQGFRATWAQGLLVVAGGALLVVLSLALYQLTLTLLKIESSNRRADEAVAEIRQAVKRLHPPLATLAAEALLSDGTRRVIHRDREREALRNAARADIVKGNWEMADFIIEQMEKRFGLGEEAARLRAEMEQARRDTIEIKIDEALEHIQRLFEGRDWRRAESETGRLMRLFPDNEQVQSLPERMQAARDSHKQELLTEWDLAVKRNDVDRGIDILRDLDPYLTKGEVAKLTDSARDVFKAKLVNLGVRFNLAVSEQRWRDALEVGLQIQEEFPNSRMAREFAQNVDVLRRRAGLVADVTMGPTASETESPSG